MNDRASANANAAKLPTDQPELRPVLVSKPERPPTRITAAGLSALILLGALLGLAAIQVLKGRTGASLPGGPREIVPVEVGVAPFKDTLRVGGTVGAVNLAMIRAPRMRGGRDRGGGGGGGPGGGSLTIESLADAGSVVRKGEIVAVFESQRTADFLDNYRSNLAQTKRRSVSRQAGLLISAATLQQDHRNAVADADKARLDLEAAEVKSRIQAEILDLRAQQMEATASQLEQEVRLSRLADAADHRIAEIDVEQAERRLERTESDLLKMQLRAPVSGLVVLESIVGRDSISQATEGAQMNPGGYFMRIVDLSTMAVFASLNQADAQLVEIGSPVEVQLDAYPDATFSGRVASIGAMALGAGTTGGGRGGRGSSRGTSSRWVRQVPIRIDILTPDDRIRPDLSASADIQINSEEGSLVIPRAALGTSEGLDIVWVQTEEGYEPRTVQVGLLGDTEATIRSGLSVGDVIASQAISDRDELADL